MMLMFMSIFIMGVIFLSEKENMLVYLSEILLVICLLFFISTNLLMLYIFFELSIFPILVMILGYGSQIEKINSAYYLIFYAVMCSGPFLYVYFCSEFYFAVVYFFNIFSWEMIFILTICFMVKFPVYFLHLWLPKAHVEAPTTASMLLAGLLLKLGTGGYLRLTSLMMYTYMNFWLILSLVGMIVSAFMCLFQSDAKAVAAFSSIVHMSFVLFGLIILMKSTKMGACLMMLSHGYTSTLMFFMVGEFFHKSGTRMMNYLSGFMASSMLVSYTMMLVFLSNGGVPPTISFVSEYITIISIFLGFKSLFMILFLYFFIAFYYSLFILTSALMGGKLLNFSLWLMSYTFPGLVLMFNFFWLSLLIG
uniref:NADH-ubiquinone oxidoreductase chain 4 n=1 Tax=Hammerschmidtiella sp. ZengetLiu-2016 TaxID=2025463 RepID=A0A3S6J420_9BILA|nr:NADH dehydrogenase subunit 4 [Hammerschmidtiella sp. ZengetLiu-2016]